MITNKRNIISILFLIVLLIPAAAKLYHHHHGNEYLLEEQSNKTAHFSHKCIICDFEFSVFDRTEIVSSTTVFGYYRSLICLFSQSNPSGDLKYSILLRAPPLSF